MGRVVVGDVLGPSRKGGRSGEDDLDLRLGTKAAVWRPQRPLLPASSYKGLEAAKKFPLE